MRTHASPVAAGERARAGGGSKGVEKASQRLSVGRLSRRGHHLPALRGLTERLACISSGSARADKDDRLGLLCPDPNWRTPKGAPPRGL